MNYQYEQERGAAGNPPLWLPVASLHIINILPYLTAGLEFEEEEFEQEE